MLDLDRAIYVGLVVNELVTNVIKHAFPAGRPGTVAVALREAGDQVHLQVRDNGRGLPTGLELEHARSLGLRTVHILARRLEAKVTVDPPREPKNESPYVRVGAPAGVRHRPSGARRTDGGRFSAAWHPKARRGRVAPVSTD